MGANLESPYSFGRPFIQSDIHCIGREVGLFFTGKITAISSEKLFGVLARCYD